MMSGRRSARSKPSGFPMLCEGGEALLRASLRLRLRNGNGYGPRNRCQLGDRHGTKRLLLGTAADRHDDPLLLSIATHRELHLIADAMVEHRVEDIRGTVDFIARNAHQN